MSLDCGLKCDCRSCYIAAVLLANSRDPYFALDRICRNGAVCEQRTCYPVLSYCRDRTSLVSSSFFQSPICKFQTYISTLAWNIPLEAVLAAASAQKRQNKNTHANIWVQHECCILRGQSLKLASFHLLFALLLGAKSHSRSFGRWLNLIFLPCCFHGLDV